ncbi:MAG: FAD-binding protein [Caldilineaceae bacterium]
MTPASQRPQSIDEISAAVRAASHVVPVGGGTKTGVLRAAPPDTVRLDMTGYAGIIEYEPGEYTFTARAGTTVAVLRDALAAHGQYLPFDPPFAAAGATLGGVAASGLKGSARSTVRRRARFPHRRAFCGRHGRMARRRQGGEECG